MTILAAALAIGVFVIAFRGFSVLSAARGAVLLASGASSVIRDSSLGDDEKEVAIQKAALAMLRAAGSIFWRIAATLLTCVIPIYLLDWVGLVAAGSVFAFLARPDVIIGTSALIVAAVWLWSQRPEQTSQYSVMDRAMHRLAFSAPFVQMTAADVEDMIFASDLRNIADKPPVFITSLARAGTTVVLNALHDVPGVATHLYRDMPFVMAPLLWSRLSDGFRRDATLAERAHGDGIQIGFDSPEAFEEVLWRQFWPQHFKGDTVSLWTTADANEEARQFFQSHFRKIISLRAGPGGRYVSKNNGNIARLDLLDTMFPGADIVVPLRHPGEHAASLLRQHLNFKAQHQADPFIKRYMRDIGHLEFGALHRPIAFEGFAQACEGLTPELPDYWLAYWICANRAIEVHANNLIILPETALQTSGQAVMKKVCTRLGFDAKGVDFSAHFKPIPARANVSDFAPHLLQEALDLYQSLATSDWS